MQNSIESNIENSKDRAADSKFKLLQFVFYSESETSEYRKVKISSSMTDYQKKNLVLFISKTTEICNANKKK